MATQSIIPAANGFLKFYQFAKLEDSTDGGAATVWGIATWERPDSDDECCDYESAVPVYQAWSGKALKRTTRAGQEPSLGNVRVQHGAEVGGKVTKVDFDDTDKEIRLGSEPIDDAMYQKLKKGMYTGYSQGGSYAWRACNVCETPLPLQQGNNFCPTCDKFVTVRYGLKKLAEVSYVDSPATGEGFEHVKSNGSTEILKFQKKEPTVNKDKKTKRVAGVDLPSHCFAYVGDEDKTETWKLPIEFPGDDEKTKRHIRNALARFEQTQGIPDGEKAKVNAKIEAAARSHGIEVDGAKAVMSEVVKSMIDKAAEAKGLQKSLYDVARFADILMNFSSMYEWAMIEAEIEGDGSEVPADLKQILEDMIESFLAMAEEEARELSAKKTEQPGATMTPEELEILQKAAKKSLASHFAKAASHHEKMADKHEALADLHEDAAAHHEKMADGSECKCGKSTKSATGEVNKEDVGSGAEHMAIHDVLADQQEYHKAMGKCEMAKAKHHDGMAKAHDAHAAHLTKMAESHDEESAKAVKAEIAAEDAAFAKANPEPIVPVPVVKGAPTMDDDVKKAAEAQRNTPEYKAAIESIAKAQVDAEVAKLRDSTLAPLGAQIDEATGQAVIKGLKVVPRDEDKVEFAFAGAAPVSNTGGL